MTVENIKNKMSPLQMGVTAEFPFNFAVLLQDPTEEEALQAIKAKVALANGKEIELVYGTDYTVELNTDRLGGTLTVKNLRTSADYITIFREYDQTQEVDYRDFNSAPAETFEQCFDKLTMLSQQQQEQIDRSLKFSVSSTSVNPSLPEPVANNTLIWNAEGTDFKNYDIISENNQFKADVNSAVSQGQANIQTQLDTFEAEQTQELEQFKTTQTEAFETFKTTQTEAFEEYKEDVNADIETVLDAAGRVEQLEGSVATAVIAAEQAMAAANNATTAANNAQVAANNATNALVTTANKDLSNLTETGENKFVKTADLVEVDLDAKANRVDVLTKTQITNCLLEVPQNIKLELNNGTLTLKAGSKVIVPNGAGVFNEVTITTDIECVKTGGSGQVMITVRYDGSIGQASAISNCKSGAGISAEKYSAIYDTTANTVYRYGSDTTGGVKSSLPIAICTQSDSVFTSIDQIFNGIGYIGSTIWVDKGVKRLVPNGRNADGSLNNTEYITSKVSTITLEGNSPVIVTLSQGGSLGTSTYYAEQEEKPTTTRTLWYKPSTNTLVRIQSDGTIDSGTKYAVVARVNLSNSVPTSFQPKLPFRAVDYNDFANTPRITQTYKNGTSWYYVRSDGFCVQGGQISGDTVTFLKTYTSVPSVVIAPSGQAASSGYNNILYSVTTTGFTMYARHAWGGWVAYGYIN